MEQGKNAPTIFWEDVDELPSASTRQEEQWGQFHTDGCPGPAIRRQGTVEEGMDLHPPRSALGHPCARGKTPAPLDAPFNVATFSNLNGAISSCGCMNATGEPCYLRSNSAAAMSNVC